MEQSRLDVIVATNIRKHYGPMLQDADAPESLTVGWGLSGREVRPDLYDKLRSEAVLIDKPCWTSAVRGLGH